MSLADTNPMPNSLGESCVGVAFMESLGRSDERSPAGEGRHPPQTTPCPRHRAAPVAASGDLKAREVSFKV